MVYHWMKHRHIVDGMILMVVRLTMVQLGLTAGPRNKGGMDWEGIIFVVLFAVGVAWKVFGPKKKGGRR